MSLSLSSQPLLSKLEMFKNPLASVSGSFSSVSCEDAILFALGPRHLFPYHTFLNCIFNPPHPSSLSQASIVIKWVLISSDSSHSTMLSVTLPDSATYTPVGFSEVTFSPSGSLQRAHLLAYTLRTHGLSCPFTQKPWQWNSLVALNVSPCLCSFSGNTQGSFLSHSWERLWLLSPPTFPVCCFGAFWIPSCEVCMGFAHWAPRSHIMLTSVPTPILSPGSFLTPLLKPNDCFSMPAISPASARHLQTHAKIDPSYLE